MENWSIADWLHVASAVVTLASVLAALTPTPQDDSFVAQARWVLDLLACNWGYAKNAPPKLPPTDLADK
jgi:hypothetical protein